MLYDRFTTAPAGGIGAHGLRLVPCTFKLIVCSLRRACAAAGSGREALEEAGGNRFHTDVGSRSVTDASSPVPCFALAPCMCSHTGLGTGAESPKKQMRYRCSLRQRPVSRIAMYDDMVAQAHCRKITQRRGRVTI